MKSIFEAIDQADHGLVWQLVHSRKSELGLIDKVTGLTPLALASELGRTESVRTLIEAGANPDAGGVSSPLESAVAEGHIEIARMLIDAGADVNKKVGEGFAPLMSAAFLGDIEIVRLLLEKGAQPRARNFDGETAIDLASEAGFEELSREIRSFSHKDFEQERERLEAEKRRLEEEELQKRREERRARVRAARAERAGGGSRRLGPSSNDRSSGASSRSSRSSPFGGESQRPPERFEAPRSSSKPKPKPKSKAASAFDALFAPVDSTPAPIDPNQLEGIERFEALLQTAPVLARRMIDFGQLSGDERTFKNETPLMLGAAAGETEVVRVLLAKSVEVDLQDSSENRETALLKAVQTPSRGRLEVIDLLVDAGSDLERRHGDTKRTPLMFAAQADVYTPDPYARNFGQTTQHLIKLGANLATVDARGDDLLQIIKRAAIGAPTSSPFRSRLFDMQKLIEKLSG